MLMCMNGVYLLIYYYMESLAFKYGDVSKISPILYAQVPAGFLCDVLMFDHKFSVTDIVGALVITVFVAIPIIKNWRTK